MNFQTGWSPSSSRGMGSEAPHSCFMEGGDSEVRDPILNGARIPHPPLSPSAWSSTAQMAWITKPWGSSSRGWPRPERGPASTSSTGSRYLRLWGTAGTGVPGPLYGLSAPQRQGLVPPLQPLARSRCSRTKHEQPRARPRLPHAHVHARPVHAFKLAPSNTY